MKYRMTLSTRFEFAYLPPATRLRQGNVFTHVCDSVHGRGGSLSRGGSSVPGGLSAWGSLLGRPPPPNGNVWAVRILPFIVHTTDKVTMGDNGCE